MRRRRLITVVAAALLAGAIAAGVSYATIPGAGNVYSACMLKGIGTIRLIDKSLPDSNLMSRCKPSLETEVSWNQQGPAGLQGANGAPGAPGTDGTPGQNGANGTNGRDGADGVSVTSDSEPAGDNCTNGGSKFTAANGVTYACNGASADGTAFISTEVGPANAAQPQTAWITIFEDPHGGSIEAACNRPHGRAFVRWTNTTSMTKDFEAGHPYPPGSSAGIGFGEKRVFGLADEPGLIVEWIEGHRWEDGGQALFCQVFVWVTPTA